MPLDQKRTQGYLFGLGISVLARMLFSMETGTDKWTKARLEAFARDLHDSLVEVRDGDLDQACSTAVYVLSLFVPETRRCIGTYEGWDHEWARVGSLYIDVTGSQFGRQSVLVSRKLPEEYDGRAVPMTDPRSTPYPGDVNAPAVARAMERRGWTLP